MRTFGPPPRDELAERSTARLARAPLPPTPAWADCHTVRETLVVAGRDVVLRRTDGPAAGSAPTWCVHGLEGSGRDWDQLAALLATRSTVYAPDLPGSGLSAPPARGGYALDAQVEWLRQLIGQRSAEPVHLVGNSRGGVLAILLAGRHPELVRSLTLLAPAVADFRMTADRGAHPLVGLVMVPGVGRYALSKLDSSTADVRAERFIRNCFGEPDNVAASDYLALAADIAHRAALPWSRQSVVASLQTLIYAQLRRGPQSIAAAAAQVQVPTLVAWGTRDRLVDVRLAERTTARFDQGSLLVVPRAGHLLQRERPELVAQAMFALWQQGGERATASSGAPVPTATPSMET